MNEKMAAFNEKRKEFGSHPASHLYLVRRDQGISVKDFDKHTGITYVRK